MDMRGAPYLNKRLRGLINVAGPTLQTGAVHPADGGMPSVTGKDPAGHMLLVRERFPDVYERTYNS